MLNKNKEAMKMATDDIKANKIAYNKKTSLKEAKKIIKMCEIALERCKND